MNEDNKVERNKLLTGDVPRVDCCFNTLYMNGSKRFIPATNFAANIGNFEGFKALSKIFMTLGRISLYWRFLIDMITWLKTLGRVT